MRVYYFTGAQYALSNIALRRVKISRFRDLNDPFELMAVNLGDKRHREAFSATKQDIDKDKGLICFSRSWKNPLLWGHYAEKHTGIALGFDIPDHQLTEVLYEPRLLDISLDPKTKRPRAELIDKLIRTKFHDWKYEDEWRLFIELEHDTVEAGLYFHPFSKEFALREVILGPRCELPMKGVRNMVKVFRPDVQIVKSSIAFTRFEVLESKAATRADAKP